MCKIIKYLDYTKLNTLEKLYFDLTIMLIVTFLSFLFLVFEFFIYENIAVFFQDCFFNVRDFYHWNDRFISYL